MVFLFGEKMKKKNARRIQLKAINGSKIDVRLPELEPAEVKQFKQRAQSMRRRHVGKHPITDADARYIEDACPAVLKALEKLGLYNTEESTRKQYELGEKLSEWTEAAGGMADQKKKLNIAKKLQAHFGPKKDVRTIRVSDGLAFRKALADSGQAENSTVSRNIGYCRQFYNYLIEDKLVSENPFKNKKQKITVLPNPEKEHYITPEDARKLWEVIDNDNDKMRFLLMRRMGFRAPSEINALTWEDVNWTKKELLIRSPKTGLRRMPFAHPDIEPLMKKLWEQRKSDKHQVVPNCENGPLSRKVKKWAAWAGIPLWPGTLKAFRASAATDAFRQLPPHEASAYIGHSYAIFKKHYARQTEEQKTAFTNMAPLLP